MDIKGVVSGINPYLNPKTGAAEGREIEEQAGKNAAQQVNRQTGDTVNISDAAKMQAMAAREATASPDVRQDRVAELKAKVQSGEYKPDSRRTAAGIIKNDLGLLTKR